MVLWVAALFFDPLVPRIDPQSWIVGRKGVVSLIFLHSNERKPSKTQYKVVFLQLIFLASRMLLPSQASLHSHVAGFAQFVVELARGERGRTPGQQLHRAKI